MSAHGDDSVVVAGELLADMYTAKNLGTLGCQEGTRLTRNRYVESRVRGWTTSSPAAFPKTGILQEQQSSCRQRFRWRPKLQDVNAGTCGESRRT